MTEADWLAACDPEVMLNYFRVKPRRRPRQFRLFGIACCRCIWKLIPDARSRAVIEVAERFADGLANESELEQAEAAAAAAHREAFATKGKAGALAEWAPVFTAETGPFCGAKNVSWMAARAALDHFGQAYFIPRAELIRHIFGNPFRPYPAPAAWSANLIGLAQALYDGDDNRLILADALEEAGHDELAAHFRHEEWHPKGCWVVDLILGKQ